MSLIERAARALAASADEGLDWDALDPATKGRFRDSVRKVLETLRDPEAHMTEAGAEIVRNIGPAESAEAHRSDAANTWRFMIDALLGEDRSKRE